MKTRAREMASALKAQADPSRLFKTGLAGTTIEFRPDSEHVTAVR